MAASEEKPKGSAISQAAESVMSGLPDGGEISVTTLCVYINYLGFLHAYL